MSDTPNARHDPQECVLQAPLPATQLRSRLSDREPQRAPIGSTAPGEERPLNSPTAAHRRIEVTAPSCGHSFTFAWYNFCRIHQTLRVTPAMEAGISYHAWTIEELCGLLPETASATKRIDKGLTLRALGEKAS